MPLVFTRASQGLLHLGELILIAAVSTGSDNLIRFFFVIQDSSWRTP
jgi:hypothetical protein